MKWAIVADSSCDMCKADFTYEGIEFASVPLKINVGEHEYVDDGSIDVEEMLADMKSNKSASSSACPPPEKFMDAFENADNIICITISHELSGTYNCACIARDMILEEHPDKKIYVLDSLNTAGVMVLLIRRAAELIEKGMEFDDVCKNLKQYSSTVNIVFSLSCFDNLVKNGRMSAIVGLIASRLGIRAVAQNKNGKIEVVKKPRGEDKAINAMVELMAERCSGENRPIVINHCMNPLGAKKCAELIKQTLHTVNITIMECKGLTSFYAMNDGLLIGY